jgi:integrase/recombinase XerD
MASRNGIPKKSIPGDASDPAGLTALLHRYLTWLETHHFAANTVNIRRLQLARFISWCDDRSVTRAAEVTPELIERFQRHLFYYRQKNGQPLSISSQSHWLSSLRSWMTWLKKQHLLEQNPAQEMTFPQEEKRLPRHALSQEEVEAVLEQPDITRPCGLRMRAILELFYSSGLRRQEVLNLELSDIDRPRRVILVRLGKGKKDRYVPVGERALFWLDKYLAEARPQLCRDDPQQRLVFVSTTGHALHANCISTQVRRLMNRAGITKGGSCHLFRHTAASLMLDRGADVRHLQEILGHKNLGTTQIYTHVSIGKLCEVHAKTHPGRLLRSSPERRRYAWLLSPLRQHLRQLAERLFGWVRRRSSAATEA